MTPSVSMFMVTAIVTGLALWALPAATAEDASSQPWRQRDYSFGWWPNGFRREAGDTSPTLFCVQTGHYALALDLADLSRARFGRVEGPGYLAAAQQASFPLEGLPAAQLSLALAHGGKTYRAVSCLAGRTADARQSILLESGRFVQHYRFPQLEFRNEAGEVLATDSALDLVAWPSSLTFSLTTAPDCAYADGPCPGVVGAGRAVLTQPLDVPSRPELDRPVFTLEVWVRIPDRLSALNGRHWLLGKNANEWQEGNYGLLLTGDTVTAVLNIGGGRENVFSVQKAHALPPGDWHHLAMSYGGDILRLYVDGTPAGATTIDKARVPGDGLLRIGGRPDGFGQPVHALFDEVRLWDRVLSAGEIKAHAAAPGSLDQNGLSWRLSFDEGAEGGKEVPLPNLNGATVRLSLGDWSAESHVPGQWVFGETKTFVLNCPVVDEPWQSARLELAARGSKGMVYPTRYRPEVGAYVVDVPTFQRDWQTGYTDVRNYDEVLVQISNPGAEGYHVPVLFDVRDPANITGETPILCDPEGRPTGIPIQLSKNWHHGAYSKFYTILPCPPGQTEYRLRIAYGFWGKLPAASHAQLSLYGYGGNGRWDQLAIGCWGETMCLDMDNSLTPMMVTDVRMLMTRKGRDGRKWSWSDGGWGGDWLEVYRGPNDKLHPVALKTAYLAQGPCLTDVRYNGYYGKERDVALGARVATLRTDDYNRVFQQFDYRFTKPLGAAGTHFFKMGPNDSLITPRLAYGNRDGLIAEHAVPGDLQANHVFRERTILTGQGPWWVAFPGSYFSDGRDWGTGSRALIIRSFRAVFGGKPYDHPVVLFPVQKQYPNVGLVGLNLELVAPEDVTQFVAGDRIEMDVEWITVPRVADDYYGPNQAFLAHLQQHPESWQTVYREAIGNDLAVKVTGGELRQRYPVIVAAAKPEVEVEIKGGVGVVPLRFEGLPSVRGYRLYRLQGGQQFPLDQAEHGNDYWQTDYDAESGTYRMTFNLPLDGIDETKWVLSRQ